MTQHRKARGGGLRLPPPEVRLKESLTPDGDCLIRTTNLNQKGYSRLTIAGKQTLCHRFAYEIANGPIPEGQVVMHKCDNPPCCNPEHLTLGTKGDNNRDMFNKGRGCPPPGRGWFKIPPERHGEIGEAFCQGETKTSIALRFGVTRPAIAYVLKGMGL